MPEISVLHTKLNPPRLPRHTLVRPRVNAQLRQALDCAITIVQASTGYGKSTALANLSEAGGRLFWYTAGEGDADPQQFLAHLITAFRFGIPELGDAPLALLQEPYAGAPRVAADALLNALNDLLAPPRRAPARPPESAGPSLGESVPFLLVIDDYHLASSAEVDALLDHMLSFLPPDLHVVISTRYAPPLEHLASWRARGQILEIKREALAFTRDEIATLFRDKYGLDLTAREVELLAEKTEGWPIALQLVWQEIRAKPHSDMETLLGPGSGSLETLFAFLAQNVLAQQPQPVQDFLLQTAVLREIGAEVCKAVTAPPPEDRAHTDGCGDLLAYLLDRDLFLISTGSPAPSPPGEGCEEHLRYHHLFHDFLREQAERQDAAAVRARHRRAAEFYRRNGNIDEAMYHLLSARAFAESAGIIEEVGETLVRTGRLDTLAGWIDALPPEMVATHPLLMFLLGDLARLRSRFDDALAWYAQAERVWRAANDIGGISRALRGQALVYLDTVRPARAEDLLEESLRLNDGLDDRVARARLLELLAENKLNMGKAEEAEQLHRQARTLREEGPSEDVLSVRVKLRTGQLDRARETLETWAGEERGKSHPPRAHRETLLILSLIYAMQGRGEDAGHAAQEALSLASQLHSPFVSAVGQMRLGHARQVKGDFAAALKCYEEAVSIGDQLAVRRTRAEARWGMTRAHGFSGDLNSARRDAAEGIEVGRSAGDAWIVALVQIGLGASLVLAGQDREATDVLGDALAAFHSCGDKFGVTAARQWLALAHWHLNQRERAMTHFNEALALAQAEHYDYILTTCTLLGWQDARVAVPLLLHARRRGKHAAYAARLMAAMGLENVSAHAGYQLRVQTLGPFQVWRGAQQVTPREWQRRKARELFQLLLTRRGRLLEREEIYELLWSEEAPQAAAGHLKVALNALNKVLEPARDAEDTPAFIIRDETSYGLRPGADIWTDADEFTRRIERAEKNGDLDEYRGALELYRGDYLEQDARYADWATAERERLLTLYLRAADGLAAELLARGQPDECIAWCERVLARDRCWEHAYRLMMQSYAQRGDRALARRVFERCTRVLREELQVEPSPATVQIMQQVCSPLD